MVSRKEKLPPITPTPEDFRRGYLAFRDRERRDAMYRTAMFLVKHFWGKPAEIANGLGVLLLTWNQAHYRYGPIDFQLLENVLADNQQMLESFRRRNIFSYVAADDPAITSLFDDMLTALQICDGKSKGKKSPVAVAKALHLLAPGYFPLWDREIANAYRCNYDREPTARYLVFFGETKRVAEELDAQGVTATGSGVTFLKLIDEYNYAKYTKDWIECDDR